MGNKRYVLDANIFIEYIFARPLQDKAKQIIQDAVFITNDKKHISKVKEIGHIQALSNYG